MTKLIIFISCMWLFILGASSPRVIVTLKSGKTIEGKMVSRTESSVTVETYYVELLYWMDEIEEIIYVGSPQKNQPNNDTGPTKKEVIIKGEVICDNYKQGYIQIGAYDHYDLLVRERIIYAEILEPGPFTLYLPPGTKEVFLMGYNDVDDDGPPYRKGRDITFANGSLNQPLIITDAITEGVVMAPVGKNKTD